MEKPAEKSIRKIFTWSLILKALNALLEIIGGVLFLFTGTVAGFVEVLVKGELIEDPNDFIANIIQQYLPSLLQHSQVFFAIYLLSHGIIKIVLVTALLKNKLWAYPAAIVAFSLFIVYQLYRFSYTHSLFLLYLTIFDFAVIWLVWHEYRVVKKLRTIEVQTK